LIVINNPAHHPWRTAGLLRMSGPAVVPAITHRTTTATSNELAGNTVV
jgi:hypothetical protein